MEKKEFIIAAAIHFNDGGEHVHQPDNITEGFVVVGRRHHNCYATLSALSKSIKLESTVKLLIDKADRDRQGFITNLNRYVSRAEAFIIAKLEGQIIHKMFDKDETGILTSEDLW